MQRKIGHYRVLRALAALIVFGGTVAAIARAAAPSVLLSEAEIFLELNDTDGDLGIHGSIDGEPWTVLKVEGPGDRELLSISSRNRLKTQGMTQLSFESAEPPFDELDPSQFFMRFPEGVYEIEGRAKSGELIEGSATLSHVLAAPAGNIRVNGIPAAESCDEEPLPKVSAPVTIRWDPVMTSHPTIGNPGPVTISRYQFFVERENVKLSLDLPPTVTRFEIPKSITSLGKDFKFEIIARTSTGNNTAVETCFELQ
jgi:hypothetical protein